MGATTDLIPGLNLNELMSNRERLLEMSRAAFTTLLEVERLSLASGFQRQWSFCWDGVRLDEHHLPKFQDDPVELVMEEYTNRLDTSGWEHLLHATGLRTFMDSEARGEWDRAVQKRVTPPLEMGAIEETFRSLHGQRGSMVERGVVEAFRRLSWDHKTNQPCLFGKKIIVKHFLDYSGCLKSDAGGLEDLERAMCIYEGKPEPDHRAGFSFLMWQAEKAMEFETQNLHVRWFKNGNAHATFKNQELVDKLNQVIGKHYPGALPAPKSGATK